MEVCDKNCTKSWPANYNLGHLRSSWQKIRSVPAKSGKVGCVVPMTISSEFRAGQYWDEPSGRRTPVSCFQQNFQFYNFNERLSFELECIKIENSVNFKIFGVTYLAWFNVSPFAFIRAGGVLGHGVPLSKCRYVPTSQYAQKFQSSVYDFSRFYTIYETYILSGFYSVLFNIKWLWLVHSYILYNRSLTKALLIAHCLFHRKKG